MALTTSERERVRYHLGYLQVQPAASIQFGLPRPIQTIFLVETAMDNILAVAEDRVRRTLNVLDGIECRMIEAQDRLAAVSLGELVLRSVSVSGAGDEHRALRDEYRYWAGLLADIFGVPLYPYSVRFRGPSGNVPVSG